MKGINENEEDEQIINDQNADEWSRKWAGTPSYCPYCGYSVVNLNEEDDNIHTCPECSAKYALLDLRWIR